jgi:hypothetical protein
LLDEHFIEIDTHVLSAVGEDGLGEVVEDDERSVGGAADLDLGIVRRTGEPIRREDALRELFFDGRGAVRERDERAADFETESGLLRRA